MTNRFCFLIFCLLASSGLYSQEFNFPMTPMPLSDWQVPNTTWTKANGILINPFEAKKMKVISGENLLIANGKGGTIVSKTQVEDVKVRFEFMLGSGGETIFYVGKVGILLNNSWDNPTKLPCGTIQKSDGNTQISLQDACRATGLWQTLELTFSTSKKGEQANFEKIALNGITLQENYFVGNLSETPTTFSFENKEGIFAFRNFEYLPLSTNKPLIIKDLSYKVFDVWQFENPENKKPVEAGNAENLTQEYGSSYKNFSLIYAGKIKVAKTAKYLFSADYAGKLSLKIDSKVVIDNPEFTYRIPQNASLDLSEGEHDFELKYAKAWWKPAMGLYVTAAGIRPYALHSSSSLPEADAVGEIVLHPKASAEIVRSFMMFEGKKRTHSISVGSPQGIHYSFDLNQGTLLYAWKGEFADLTDMWYERGEPQLLKPKGVILKFSGKPAVAVLPDVNSLFPDSVDAFHDLIYKGYTLSEGNPIFLYSYAGAEITQKITPIDKGLSHFIEAKGQTNNLYCKVAEGKDIQQVDKNLFLVDNYYLKFTDKTKPIIRQTKAGQEIILPLTNSVVYSIIW